MFRFFTTILFSLLLGAAAFGQQQATDRVATQIGNLVIQNAALSTQVEQLQGQLKAAQDRIKELETKAVEKKP